jgi:hypothetical protein
VKSNKRSIGAPKRKKAAKELAKKLGIGIKNVYLTSGDDDLLLIIETHYPPLRALVPARTPKKIIAAIYRGRKDHCAGQQGRSVWPRSSSSCFATEPYARLIAVGKFDSCSFERTSECSDRRGMRY